MTLIISIKHHFVLFVMLNVVMLNVVMLNVVMLGVIMLSVIMLSVVMLNAVILSVIRLCHYAECSVAYGELYHYFRKEKKNMAQVGSACTV
jgi:hypothetical protein